MLYACARKEKARDTVSLIRYFEGEYPRKSSLSFSLRQRLCLSFSTLFCFQGRLMNRRFTGFTARWPRRVYRCCLCYARTRLMKCGGPSVFPPPAFPLFPRRALCLRRPPPLTLALCEEKGCAQGCSLKFRGRPRRQKGFSKFVFFFGGMACLCVWGGGGGGGS